MKTSHFLMLIAVCMLALTGCSNDDIQSVDTTPADIRVSFTTPAGYSEELTMTDVHLTLTEINTGKETAFSFSTAENMTVTLNSVDGGYYRISATGKLNYRNSDLVAKTVEVTAYSDGTTLSKENAVVLAEIFCAGTINAQGSYYYADKYFVIYNNTDHVLYADSLVIAESDFLTTMKQEYKPNIMDTDMAVAAMYMIPGTGRDVPVQPGGKLLIVDNAVDHTVANPNSWNMTTADYEWYDESTNPQFTDIDNPKVPNLEKIYCSTLTLWSPHTQGFKSYALARMHTDKKTFLVDYIYDYAYHLTGQTGEADMTGTSYRLPNSWILDAVNMSTKAGFQWIVTSPALDRGFTYNSEFNWDDSRFGKSVRRKVVAMDGSRAILADTNNSTEDFESRVKADPFHVFGMRK